MEWEDHIRTLAAEVRKKTWALQTWRPGPALFPKNKKDASAKYIGQSYDPTKYELIEDGWDHEHCPFCGQSICGCGSANCQAEGFTDGRDWICRACHEKVVTKGVDPAPPRIIGPKREQ